MNRRKTSKITKIKFYAFLVVFLSVSLLLIPIRSFATQNSDDGELVLKLNGSSRTIPYSEYSKWFTFSPALSLDRSYRSEIENVDFCPEPRIFCDLLLTKRERIHTKKNVAIDFEKGRAEIFLKELAEKTDKKPTDAKFKIENGKVSAFEVDQKGARLEIEKSLGLLSALYDNNSELHQRKEISLPYQILESGVMAKDINNLGIDVLIGEGKSNFKGSTASRIHNIKVATAKYDGILLPPGTEFSFVDILGPVDGEHGYLPELVIKKDKTEPEFGGGICQVSTTAFRAAVYSGLEITARKNHAYPVSYYDPQGMDATIYVPRPDLKFKNNTPGHILIQAKITGTELTFSFYGTNDGRRVEVDGPRILEKKPDGSMRTVFTQKVFSENGSEIINDTFNSVYDSPDKYPHPSREKFTKKPKDWSKSQWELYKKVNGI